MYNLQTATENRIAKENELKQKEQRINDINKIVEDKMRCARYNDSAIWFAILCIVVVLALIIIKLIP